MKKNSILSLVLVAVSACGGSSQWVDQPTNPTPNNPPKVDIPDTDGFIPRARAVIHLSSDKDSLVERLFNIAINKAYAATVSVTYTVSASATFTVNTTSLLAGSMTGNTLSFGSATISALDDNSLKICGVSNNQKCTTAVMRIYTTTASTSGLVHDVDGYGLPVYSDKTTTPTTVVGLGSANAAIVQSYTIPGNKNRIRLSNFPTPTYNVTADLENAGAGSYSMTLVIEYALGL